MDNIRPRLSVIARKKPMKRIVCNYLHVMIKHLKMTPARSINRHWLAPKRSLVVQN